ncbi:MAG: hypothetical protein P4L51_29075 [Puia sp.]|nr:hypothetical protein [Puia sp.]
MFLSERIKKAIEVHPGVIAALKGKGKDPNWNHFTRTQFNLVARVINKQVSREVIANTDLAEMHLIIGKAQLEKHLHRLRHNNVYDFSRHLGDLREYQVFSWISGKTLQSYWQSGSAKYVKINVLLVFLQVPFSEWEAWQKDRNKQTDQYGYSLAKSVVAGTGPGKSSLSIVKTYYLGNYFLYYQKTDGSKNIIKTPFILKEHENGQVIVKSVSEGHRYGGKVMGIRDGCLYINCQNLDFEEMEQYVFNIGLETKPQVLFGVSNTVSVKNRRAVALKNILVKQQVADPGFEHIQETEIPFSKKYTSRTEEALVVGYLKQASNNIIVTPSCCNLAELENPETAF